MVAYVGISGEKVRNAGGYCISISYRMAFVKLKGGLYCAAPPSIDWKYNITLELDMPKGKLLEVLRKPIDSVSRSQWSRGTIEEMKPDAEIERFLNLPKVIDYEVS